MIERPQLTETLELLLALDPNDVSWLTFTGLSDDELRAHLVNAAFIVRNSIKPRSTTPQSLDAATRALWLDTPIEPSLDDDA